MMLHGTCDGKRRLKSTAEWNHSLELVDPLSGRYKDCCHRNKLCLVGIEMLVAEKKINLPFCSLVQWSQALFHSKILFA